MSVTMQVVFNVQLSDGPFGVETINPGAMQFTVDGPHVRRSVTLADGASVTLDIGELTPRIWFVRNLHETNPLILSFGATDDIVLQPGDFAFFPSPSVPVARGSGGASYLYYACFQ